MSGIFGTTNSRLTSEQIIQFAKRMQHTPRIGLKSFPSSFFPAIGGVYFLQNPEELVFAENERCAIVLNGIAYQQRKRCTIQDLIEYFVTKGISALYDLDGTYSIYVKDFQNKCLYLFTDQSGTQSIYYSSYNGHFSFAPEAKVIFPMCGLRPKISMDGVIQLFNNQYTFGQTTMFEEVNQLEAGVTLHFDQHSNQLNLKRYWDLKYEPSKQTLNSAVAQLKEQVIDAHQTHFQDLTDEDKFYLLLTGGLDSRGILAISDTIGRKPKSALTWGIRDDIPNSDPFIAKHIAQEAGVPHQFCFFDESSFIENAKEWCYISELRSDNLGVFSSGSSFFSKFQADDGKFVLIGDHLFGAGGYAESVQDAIFNVLKVSDEMLVSNVKPFFTSEGAQELSERYRNAVNRIIENNPNDEPKDIQDYLYFHLYNTRWLFGPGNFKEPILQARRPFMLQDIITFVKQLPPFLRVDKKVYVKMIQKHFPKFSKYPSTSADSAILWKNAIRTNPQLKQYVNQLLDFDKLRSTGLARYLDASNTHAFVQSFLSSQVTQQQTNSNMHRFLYDMRKKVTVNPWLGKLSKNVEPMVTKLIGFSNRTAKVNPYGAIMRFALISLLQECIDDGMFGVDGK